MNIRMPEADSKPKVGDVIVIEGIPEPYLIMYQENASAHRPAFHLLNLKTCHFIGGYESIDGIVERNKVIDVFSGDKITFSLRR